MIYRTAHHTFRHHSNNTTRGSLVNVNVNVNVNALLIFRISRMRFTQAILSFLLVLPFSQAFSIHGASTATTTHQKRSGMTMNRWQRQGGRSIFMSQQESDDSQQQQEAIDLTLDSRLYKVRLSRAPGVDWGTDLSFQFVYVRDLDPAGEASLSGQVQKGDQLCEITPVDSTTGETSGGPINLLGAPFDFVMNSFMGLDKKVRDVDYVFFRGTKDELKQACSGGNDDGEPETITITVIQNKGAENQETKILTAKPGVNLRQLLVDNDINVYQSFTRWTNCKGKQLCGTCIVNVTDGGMQTNRKSMDEASTLRENPDSYRLSCITFAYGDVTVETFPPINAAQWTR